MLVRSGADSEPAWWRDFTLRSPSLSQVVLSSTNDPLEVARFNGRRYEKERRKRE